MKTYRILVDNDGKLYKDGDAVKLVLTGAKEGTYIGCIQTVGVQMLTMKFYNKETNTFSEEQLLDLNVITKIEPIYPIWLKEESELW